MDYGNTNTPTSKRIDLFYPAIGIAIILIIALTIFLVRLLTSNTSPTKSLNSPISEPSVNNFPGNTNTTPPASSTPNLPSPPPVSASITISATGLSPSTVTVPNEGILQLTNSDKKEHHFEISDNYDFGPIAPETSIPLQMPFLNPGTYTLLDRTNSSAKATLIIK